MNDHAAHPNTSFNVTADIDMGANIWVPIGTNANPYKGTFNANGHVITGVHSPLNSDNMGMFGIIDQGTVENMVLSVDFSGGNSINMGGVAAVMNGNSTIANVEAGGNILGSATTTAIGGIVADKTGGKVHSAFSVATMTATVPTTHVGGLVGDNAGDLINSYANATMTGSDFIGGLVCQNKGHIENCYSVIGQQTFPAFAYENFKNESFTGVIKICYTDTPNGYVRVQATNSVLDGYGTYDVVKERKAIGYMYDDNAIGNITGTNGYVYTDDIDRYTDNHLINWNGLLWSLNRWVSTNTDYPGCTPWFRPTSGDINGDLPILAFPLDNCLGTTDADGKFLQYGSIVGSNGLDHLLLTYNDKVNGAASSLFLYGNATEVSNVPKSHVKTFINEDAVLKQAAGAGAFINTTVGITFDNSDHGQHSTDHVGNQLLYDWHMMSSSLADASLGTTYDMGATMSYGSPVNVTLLYDSYFPNGLITADNPAVGGSLKWDLYSYFEPEYHWINLKRSTNNHWHVDGDHGMIIDPDTQESYKNETIFVPGKGYMMGINQDSYMSSTGVLNAGDVKIRLTNQEALDQVYNKGWNLVGNPYQAYLNISTLGTVYGYDADMGVYAPYTTGASTNPAIPAQNIHPHQAFFYHAASHGDTLTFTPSMATTEKLSTSYFREEQLNYPLVNIFAENARGNRDLAVVEFNRPELGGATKVKGLINANFQISASLDGRRYGLLFVPEGTEKVPLHFQTDEDGTYTLRWSTYNGDFTYLRLVDNITGVNYDMLANDSYTFEATTHDYYSRFYITYACTGLDEDDTLESNSFAFFNGSEWVVNGKGHLDVIDMTGRVLYATELNNDRNGVHLDGLAKGVYLLRVIDNKVVRIQKIVIK